MVAALDLGSSVLRRVGSSPVIRTKGEQKCSPFFIFIIETHSRASHKYKSRTYQQQFNWRFNVKGRKNAIHQHFKGRKSVVIITFKGRKSVNYFLITLIINIFAKNKIMRRFLYNDLLKWKADSARKPLILQGARQDRKT